MPIQFVQCRSDHTNSTLNRSNGLKSVRAEYIVIDTGVAPEGSWSADLAHITRLRTILYAVLVLNLILLQFLS
jgi:hypothetical protein